mmetsp:Transcript_38746/g.116403  ORF Transcript_38746/g.116403 Transcript_38746/m.116403 type:complete len:360 (+) Transcript_38746:649-1728(+)
MNQCRWGHRRWRWRRRRAGRGRGAGPWNGSDCGQPTCAGRWGCGTAVRSRTWHPPADSGRSAPSRASEDRTRRVPTPPGPAPTPPPNPGAPRRHCRHRHRRLAGATGVWPRRGEFGSNCGERGRHHRPWRFGPARRRNPTDRQGAFGSVGGMPRRPDRLPSRWDCGPRRRNWTTLPRRPRPFHPRRADGRTPPSPGVVAPARPGPSPRRHTVPSRRRWDRSAIGTGWAHPTTQPVLRGTIPILSIPPIECSSPSGRPGPRGTSGGGDGRRTNFAAAAVSLRPQHSPPLQAATRVVRRRSWDANRRGTAGRPPSPSTPSCPRSRCGKGARGCRRGSTPWRVRWGGRASRSGSPRPRPPGT